MKTSRFFIYCLIAAFTLAGCKTHNYSVDYTSHEGRKKYSLNKDKISKEEKVAWQKVTTANSVNSYKQYVRDYPDGKYVAEARSIINSAYDRNDELLAMYPNAPYDQNLAALFNSPRSQIIEVLVFDNRTMEPHLEARVQLLPTCDAARQTKKTNSEGFVVFEILAGCCYNIKVDAPDYFSNGEKICTDDFKENSIRIYLSEWSLSTGSGTPNIMYNAEENRYYDADTGELFTGTFEGKEIVNGVDVNDKKAVAAASEKKLWNEILYAMEGNNPELATMKIQDYLQQFPNGKYQMNAIKMLESIERASGLGATGEELPDDDETTTGENPPTPSAVVTNPPTVVATDTIIRTKTLLEDCAINVKSKGILAYNNLPTTMKMDTSYYALEILINDLLNLGKIKTVVEEKTGEELDTTQLVHEGTTTIGNNVVEMIRIGSWMRVTLSEPKNQNAFSISNVYETNEENLRGKNIDCDMNVKWKFLIEPKKGGDHKLLLNFYTKNDEDAPYRILLDEEKTISVKVKKPWYAQMWAQGIFVIGLLSLFLLWWRNRKKKQPDQIFGANLGIAGGLEEIATPPTKPKSIFIAYAKEDEEWTKQIYNQMKVLHKGGYANIWYDQLMEAGAEYKAEIFKHLEASDIIILNISSDFLASDFCDELMTKAMERHEHGEGVMLIPIIVRPCLWATTPLAKMMVFPQNKKPLSDEEWKNADNAIVNVMNEMEGKILN